jgi:hypothetical protein
MRRRHTREEYLELLSGCARPCRTSRSRPI